MVEERMPTMAAGREAVTAAIADQLGETEDAPRRMIHRAVRTLGAERARTLLAEALAVEAGSGLPLPDGSRRRTPGGVFFHLVRAQATHAERKAIFPRGRGSRPGGALAAPAFSWDDYGVLAPTLARGLGEASTVKITVIGRPQQVQARGEVVLVPLRSEKLPTLPKGLPTPPAGGTAYAVLIARKQWQKVADALQQPGDRLVVEGYPTLDPRFPGITVLATTVTTTALQAAKREAQRAQQAE